MKMLNKKNYLIVFLFITLFFVIMQLFIPPYIGLANNGDFERVSVKAGLGYPYDAWSEENYEDSFFRYMIPTFQEIEPQHTDFFSTSEFVVLIAKFFNKSLNIYYTLGQFDIRYVGFVLFLVYMVAIVMIFLYIRTLHTTFIVGTGCFACLFFSDILVIQYFNTFYSEATGFVFFIVIMMFSLLLLPNDSARSAEKVYLFIAMEVIASFMFIFAKFQYILFSIPLAFLFAIQLISQIEQIKGKRNKLFRNVILLIAVCSIPFSFFIASILYSNTTSNYVTTANIMLNDMLALSESPETHLASMGFSSEEIDIIKSNIGSTTFSASREFTDLLNITYRGTKFNRENQIKMIFREPSILYRLISKKSQSLFALDWMGTFQKSYNLPPYARDCRFSVLSRINNILFIKSFVFFAIVLLISVCVSICFISKQKSWLKYTPYHILLSLNAMCSLQYATVILGDSSHDSIKHFFFVNILFTVIYYATVLLLLYKFVHLIRRRVLTETR